MTLMRRFLRAWLLLAALLSACQRQPQGMVGQPTNLSRDPSMEEMRTNDIYPDLKPRHCLVLPQQQGEPSCLSSRC